MVNQPVKQRRDAETNRANVLEAAQAVCREDGFAAEIATIAARAGVGTGTVYRHFPNKDALLMAVIEQMQKETAEAVAPIMQIAEAPKALVRLVEFGLRRVERYGKLVQALEAGTAPPAFRNVIAKGAPEQVLTHFIQRGIDQGFFRADLDVAFAAQVLRTAATSGALHRSSNDRPVAELAEAVTDFLLAAFGASGVAWEPVRREES